MPTVYSLQNSTATDIAISDLPVPVTVPARGNVDIPGGNTNADVLGSFDLRDYAISGKIGLIVNGRQVDFRGIIKSQAAT